MTPVLPTLIHWRLENGAALRKFGIGSKTKRAKNQAHMGSIPPETIEQIAAANDVVEVIGAYFPLTRAGANFKALCPFHQEKTPSFIVSPSRQTFHCFGCGAEGASSGSSWIMSIPIFLQLCASSARGSELRCWRSAVREMKIENMRRGGRC